MGILARAVSGGLVSAALLLAPDAGAVARLLGPLGETPSIKQARVAVSVAPGQSTLWLSVRVDGPARRVALILPVPPSSRIDPASDAWFEALELASAPRVLPPASARSASCDETAEGLSVHDTSHADHEPSVPPAAIAVLASAAEVAAYAESQELAYDESDASALARSNGMRFVAISYELAAPGSVLETVRATYPTSLADLPLFLLAKEQSLPITLFTLAAGRARVEGIEELTFADVEPSWDAADLTSDYLEKSRALLERTAPGGVLLEASGTIPLYDFRILPGGAGAIAPVASTLFTRGADYGALSNAAECASAVAAARSAGESGQSVGTACARAELALVPDEGGGTPRCEESTGGQIAPERLRCGTIDDLALALSRLRPDRARLTRQRLLIPKVAAPALVLGSTDGAELSPVLRASELDASGCEAGSGGGSGHGAGGSFGAGGYLGAGGATGSSGSGHSGSEVVYESDSGTTDIHCGCEATSSGDSSGSGDCGGDSSGSGDDCSGDSEPDEGDDCSGDSEPNSGDDCGGDSSDAEGGDDCSGDSSGSEGGDDCGGDSSGADGGDGCSGEGSSGGGESCDGGGSSASSGECSIRRPRRAPRLSAVTLALAALLLPIRRRTRKACIR